MFVYRARLGGEARAVVGITARQRAHGSRLGTGAPGTPFRVTVHYAGNEGRIQSHRGTLIAHLPPGRRLTVASYQLSEGEVLVTFRPVAPPGRTGRGLAVSDRFRLPAGLQAWGVAALRGAALDLQVACRHSGGALAVRGSVRLTLGTPGASFPLRIPFFRLIPVADGDGLAWRALGGVTGLHLRVEPGGWIEGELVVALRCEGRPPAVQAGAPAAVRAVRELSGRVARVGAERAGGGGAVVRGEAELDLYWFDQRGRSRWTGQLVPFGAVLPLESVEPHDRLEAAAEILRLSHRVEGRQVAAHLLICVTVTALRPGTVRLGPDQFRLERVVCQAATTLSLEERLLGEPAPAPAGGGEERTVVDLPLPGPEGGWQEMAAVLGTPEVSAAAGTGRWRVRAALGGTPLDEPPYPAPLRAAAGGAVRLGAGGGLALVAGLVRVDPAGLRLRTVLAWGEALPVAAPAAGLGETFAGEIDLPGAVRTVVGIELLDRGRVRALVGLESGGLVLARGRLNGWPEGGRPLHLTATPVLRQGRWQLRLSVELAPQEP